jgi:transcriptional regulator of acetoin/glycerol metabolism
VGKAFASTHAEEVARALASGQATRSALVASWQRSARLHHLDPAGDPAVERLPAARLREAREAMGPLLASAQPSLDRLFLAVGGVGCSVLLADRHGVPVDRRGAIADDETFEAWGLWTGTDWSEDAEGTNGIGTCLVEQRALTIHRDQHFLARNALMSCTTAPIFDEHGELAAALDVSSCRADLTEGFVQLIAIAVADAARRIEAENFRLAFPSARIVVAPCSERIGAALIAVDDDDLVVGATRAVRQALDLSAVALSRRPPASDLIGGGVSAGEDFAGAERAALRRALARADGNVSEAARCLGVSRATLHRKMNLLGLGRDG